MAGAQGDAGPVARGLSKSPTLRPSCAPPRTEARAEAAEAIRRLSMYTVPRCIDPLDVSMH